MFLLEIFLRILEILLLVRLRPQNEAWEKYQDMRAN